jgi:hypothetical protein
MILKEKINKLYEKYRLYRLRSRDDVTIECFDMFIEDLEQMLKTDKKEN